MSCPKHDSAGHKACRHPPPCDDEQVAQPQQGKHARKRNQEQVRPHALRSGVNHSICERKGAAAEGFIYKC
jgi:hypothetical protein